MGRSPIITDKQFLQAIKDYPNLNDRQLAQSLNCDKNVIYRKRVKLENKNIRHFKARSISKEAFLELYEKELYDSEIAKILEVSESTINRLRNTLKLPINKIPISKDENFQKEFIKTVYEVSTIKEACKILNLDNSVGKLLAKKLKIKSSYSKKLEINKRIRENTPIYIKPSTIIKELTSEEEEILIGTLLGDACLFVPKNTNSAPQGSIRHSLKQKEYCLWKYKKLERLSGVNYEYSILNKQTEKTYQGICVLIKCHEVLQPIYDMFYCGENNKKRITEQIMNKLTPLGLAVWFMDDGSKCGNSYKLCTNGFTEEDVRKAILILKERFNLDCNVHFDKKKPIIYIRAKSTKIFNSLVEKYIHPELTYKLQINN